MSKNNQQDEAALQHFEISTKVIDNKDLLVKITEYEKNKDSNNNATKDKE